MKTVIGGRTNYGQAVGIIMLDTKFPRVPGDIGNAGTFPFPVVYESVKGANPTRVVLESDPALIQPFIEAGRELCRRGVRFIVTSCGFLAVFHREFSQAMDVPVLTSSLIQVSLVHAAVGFGTVGVLTANSRALTKKHFEAVGAARTIAKGQLIAHDLVREASMEKRVPCDLSDIVLGLKCGSSDTTSGLAPNPALGVTSDKIFEAGGSVILGEVAEFIGAEHLLASHAADKELGQKIIDYVVAMENRAKSMGCDMRGGQPTGGNIKGGLSTIEEKSLGAITKAGGSPIRQVNEYGQAPTVKGLTVMDSPGREPEILTGLAAAGCNLIAFTTGRGAPQGFPFVPVLKMTGNRNTWEKMYDHMDLDLSAVMEGEMSIPEAGRLILDELVKVSQGCKTKAEVTGYTKSMDIYTIGPII